MAPAARSLIFSAPMIDALKADRKTVTRRVLRYPASVLRKHGEHWAKWLKSTTTEVAEWRRVDRGWEPWGDTDNGGRETKGPIVPELLAPGVLVWVRETFSKSALSVYPCPACWYRADFTKYDDPAIERGHERGCTFARDGLLRADCYACIAYKEGPFKWTSARFMPKHLSRFWLEVVSVRVERLHDISEADAIAEGVKAKQHPTFFDPGAPGSTRIYEIEGEEFASARTAFAFGWDGINERSAPWEDNPWVRRIEFRRRRS